MTTLRDFISNRKSEIKIQIKVLRRELVDLQLAECALETGAKAPPEGQVSTNAMTIKDMIRNVLNADGGGLSSSDIIQKISELFGRPIERTSLSPQLSRMKEDREVWLSDNRWVLSSVRPETPVEQTGDSQSEENAPNDRIFDNVFEEDLDSDNSF